MALTCGACGDSAGSRARADVRAVRGQPAVREHVDLSVFPDRPGTRVCSIHLGGGARALGAPGSHFPATCRTSVRDHVVVFHERWRQFHEQGFVACRGHGVAGDCLEGAAWAQGNRADVDSYTWEFRLDSARRIVATYVHGAFPPWWVIPWGTGPTTLASFAGDWWGHTRALRITRHGHATERIGSGCCDPVIDLEFQLSRPRRFQNALTATATVTAVRVRDAGAYTGARRPPNVGETKTIRLQGGVITESLMGTNYCADYVSKCGF